MRSVLDALGSYEGLAAQTKLLDGAHPHPAGRPPAQVLDQYRQTTDLLRSTLLPAVKALTDRNAATLQSTYESALSGWTKINQDAFDHAIKAGQDELSGWTLIPLGALFAVLLLALAGIRPRLAEYR